MVNIDFFDMQQFKSYKDPLKPFKCLLEGLNDKFKEVQYISKIDIHVYVNIWEISFINYAGQYLTYTMATY